MSTNVDINLRPDYDQVIQDIADYVIGYEVDSDEAMDTARNCLMDSLACAFQALDYPACTRLLGPLVPGATLPGGARVSADVATNSLIVYAPASVQPLYEKLIRSLDQRRPQVKAGVDVGPPLQDVGLGGGRRLSGIPV